MVISDVLVGTFLSLDEHASQAHEVNGGHGEALPTDIRFAAEKKEGWHFSNMKMFPTE